MLIPIAIAVSFFARDTTREMRLGSASCILKDSTLIVNTGVMRRVYKVTPAGLFTTALGRVGQTPHLQKEGMRRADWELGLGTHAEWAGTTLATEDDGGFTSRHISVVSEFLYRGVRLRHTIWVYPGSGIRTQLAMQALIQDPPAGLLEKGWQQVEYIPVSPGPATVTAFGYYNDTQNRDKDSAFILKEMCLAAGTASVDWASGLVRDEGEGGWIVVKESHKCVNQQGVLTGSFQVSSESILVTGAGLEAKDLAAGGYKQCWASWIIPYNGHPEDARLALKQFDRKRYPLHPQDVYIMSNTWGNSLTPADGKYAAREESILRELASQSDLGIDVQQIDDGWQGQGYKEWKPAVSATGVLPGQGPQPVRYDVYPDGWSKVKAFAAKEKVKLGLWAAWTIPEADLRWNYDNGGFRYVKLDFSNLDTKQKLDSMMRKVRSFVHYTHNVVRINWDVTENAPRVGYFYARDLGNVYLENRKPSMPANVIYRPYLVLRDAWQLARYVNLNEFQLSIPNVDLVDKEKSDAYLYPHTYCAAITLMGSPLFFGLTQLYTEKARAALKGLVRTYKSQRDEMSKGYIFPIGRMPDNASWTGFEDLLPGRDEGYLMLFRELHNTSPSGSIRLSFIRNKQIEVTDLLSGQVKQLLVDRDGFASFVIQQPADFRFYRYKVLKHHP